MIPAADDHCDALGDPHALDTLTAGEVEADAQARRALERHGTIVHRSIGIAGATRQDRPLAHERDQAGTRELRAQALLVPVEADMLTQGLGIEIAVEQGVLHDPRKRFGERSRGLAPADAPSRRRQANGDARFDPVLGDEHAGPLQDLLPGLADADRAVPVPAVVPAHGLGEAPRQEVGRRDPARCIRGQLLGKACCAWIENDPHERRWGERVDLDAIHAHLEVTEIIRSLDLLVGPVPFAVDRVECGFQC